MAAKQTAATTAAAALADAFAELAVEGRPVTVRALRERARVSTDGDLASTGVEADIVTAVTHLLLLSSD